MAEKAGKRSYLELPETGLYEVGWSGKVVYLSPGHAYGIELVIVKCERNPDHPSITKYRKDTTTIFFDAGRFPGLAIGTRFEDRVLSPSARPPGTTHREDFSDLYLDPNDRGGTIDRDVPDDVPAPSFLGGYRDTPCMILRGADEDVFVPEAEIIRFLFGPSSDFLKGVLHGTISEHPMPRRGIFDRQASKELTDNLADGTVVILAGRELEYPEAKVAAMLILSDELWSAARSVSAQLMQQFGVQEELEPRKAYLRIAGDFRFKSISGFCREVEFRVPRSDAGDEPSQAINTKLVMTTILKWDLGLPEMRVQVLYPASTVMQGEEIEGPPIIGMHRGRNKDIELDGEAFPNPSSKARRDIEAAEIGGIAGSISSTDFELYPFELTVNAAGQPVLVLANNDAYPALGSTGLPGGTNSLAELVNLVDAGAFVSPPQPQRPLPSRLVATANAIQILVKELGGTARELGPSGWVTFGDRPTGIPFPVLSPPDEFGRRKELTWSLVDEVHGTVRLALIVEFKVGSRICLFIDAEVASHVSDGCQLLMLAPRSNECPARSELIDLLAALARRHGTWSTGPGKLGYFDMFRLLVNLGAPALLANEMRDRLEKFGVA